MPEVVVRNTLRIPQSVCSHAEEKIIEFERRIPFKGFKASHLFLNEPNFRYGDGNGLALASKEDLLLPDSWKWDDDWHVLKGSSANQSGTDPDGWMYAFNWGIAYAGSFSMTHCVRRRIWSRRRTCTATFTQEEVESGVMTSAISQDATREREDKQDASLDLQTQQLGERPEVANAQDATRDVLPAALVGAAVSGLTAPVMVTSAVAGMGFGANGIVAGSMAASMMSAEAIAAGGSIAAGGTVATLQSIGAVGLGAAAAPIGIAAGMVGGLVVVGVVYGRRSLARSKDKAAPKATNSFPSDSTTSGIFAAARGTIAAQATEPTSNSSTFPASSPGCAHAEEKIIEFERKDAIAVGDDEGLDYPSSPTNEAPLEEEPMDETKRGKATECCALCTEPFTSWLQKARIRRTKQNCRVCARPVCVVEGQSGDGCRDGCCHKARVPKGLWHRTLASLRKEDTNVRRIDCGWCSQSKDAVPSAGPVGKDKGLPVSAGEATGQSSKCSASPSPEAKCTCAEGWLCFDCDKHLHEAALTRILDYLEKAVEEDDLSALHEMTQRPLILWLRTLDCDEALNAQHFVHLSQRLLRVPAYVNNNVAPPWPRPAAKPRSYSTQLKYSALEAFKKTLNFVGGKKVRFVCDTVQFAAQGYSLLRESILPEEAVRARSLLWDQLGEFVDADTGNSAGASALPAREAAGGVPDQKQQAACVSYRTQTTQVATASDVC
jgi:hypothetical protein